MCLVGELVHLNPFAVRLSGRFWKGKRIDASLVVESVTNVLGDVIVAELDIVPSKPQRTLNVNSKRVLNERPVRLQINV